MSELPATEPSEEPEGPRFDPQVEGRPTSGAGEEVGTLKFPVKTSYRIFRDTRPSLTLHPSLRNPFWAAQLGECLSMPRPQGYLNVYQSGKLTVVSFVSAEHLDQIVVSECRAEIAELIRQHQCETLAFDLTGVKLVPSGMLGMLASLGRLGVQILVFNPSDDIREVLEITRLDSLLLVQKVDI